MSFKRAWPVFPIALSVLAGSASALSAQTELPPTGFEVGESFPVRAFPQIDDGTAASLMDFRGKKVLLHIFASW